MEIILICASEIVKSIYYELSEDWNIDSEEHLDVSVWAWGATSQIGIQMLVKLEQLFFFCATLQIL